MKHYDFLGKTIEVQRATLNAYVNVVDFAHNRTNKMLDMLFYRTSWFPEGFKFSINEWMIFWKYSCFALKKNLDENLELVENFVQKSR